MTQRASIFEDTLEVDVSDFSPKKRPDAKAPTQEQVRAVAEAANFPSRQARDVSAPAVAAAAAKSKTKREPRVHRTGRNVQFNVKASQETIDAFYAMTTANEGWVLGYTLERAIAALKRELESEA
jgi:hypothetical protein